MNILRTIALILSLGFLSSILFYKIRALRNILLIASLSSALALVIKYFGALSTVKREFSYAHLFYFKFDTFSNFFIVLILGVAVLAVLASWNYMKEKSGETFFYIFFMLTIIGMVALVYSRDMLSFFIGWEVMTIGSFLVILQSDEKERFKFGLRYFIISLMGAYSLLWAILTIYNKTHNFKFSSFNASLFSPSELTILLITISIGFLIKAAAMPFHTWAPGAYSRSPLTFTAFFSGAMSKMGIYGLFIFLYGTIGSFAIAKTGDITFFQTSYFMYTLVWIGVITAAFGTLRAILAEDIRVMLAYSSVGQLGYMIIGIGVGTTLGLTATLFHVVTHGLFKTSLFIVLAAVIHRTGKTKFHELGGLINNMPIAFIATLISIMTLAGIPPLGGFATKWLLYEAMIEKKMVFATAITMLASVGAFLYVYRLIHNLFLGQRKPEHDDVKPAPLTMQIAMILPALGMIFLGFFPNLLIKYTNLFLNLIDIKTFKLGKAITDTNFTNSYGYWNAFYLGSAVMAIFIFAVIYYNLQRRAKIYKVDQLDIYTAGEYVTRETPLNYSYNFYGFVSDALNPLLKRSMTGFVTRISKEFIALSDFVRRIYTGNGQHYAIFTMIFTIITLIYFLS